MTSDPSDLLSAIELVIELAHEYSLETRIRRLIASHEETGDEVRTLVMNADTWIRLVEELEGRTYTQQYYWHPTQSDISFFRGVPILIKEFMADMEVIAGV